ncbi:SwmB domain-containing protein [uncultured Maribacter sp.]|uniref:SwmB domain-containing protein n=1 Tax=uncultured Maribacter sp. TaxID=431308 RepID=UPI0026381E4F|nr:SwmB domain-containing protein [uncultured Maribacter sp.]
MKNIKNLFKTIFLVSLALFIACDDNEYEAPETFTDLSITFTTGASTDRVSTVNGFFSFSDLSAGAIEQEWRIPESAFFLEGPIPNNLDNHDEYIINPGETVSTDKTVHVMWTKGDTLTKVGYYAVFPDSTSFRFPAYWDSDLGEAVEDTIQTNLINGQWVAEYEFIIDVYDSVVATPEVRYLDETILDHENTSAITLNFGDQLIFEDLSGLLDNNNARPNTTKWRVHTIEEDEDDQTNAYSNTIERVELDERVLDTITFDELGDFRVELTATRVRTERLRENENIYEIPTIITVIPLTVPLTQIGQIDETDSDVIEISLTHKIKPIENSVVGNFIVEVDGAMKSIESVARNANGTKLLITLNEPLAPEDEGKTVTVAYDGASDELKSYDLRSLDAFDALPINVYVPSPMIQTGTIIESSNQKILIPFDQDIDPASISDSANAAAGFTVTLNGGSGTISTVAVNADDAKTLEIDLVEGVYTDDVIMISYTGPGDIKSVGGGSISDFSTLTLEPYKLNLLTDGGFEGNFGDYWVEGASGTGATVELSTDVAFEGTQSAKLTALKPRLESGASLNYEAATYGISYRRYILSSSVTLDDAFHQKNHGDKIWFDSSDGTSAKTPRWYGADYPAGTAPALDTWVYVEAETTFTAEALNKIVRIQPVPTSGTDYTVYYDDFKIYKINKRP